MSWLQVRRWEKVVLGDSMFDREADLACAYRLGQDFVRGGDASEVEEHFMRMFAGDLQALAEFETGKEAERSASFRQKDNTPKPASFGVSGST